MRNYKKYKKHSRRKSFNPYAIFMVAIIGLITMSVGYAAQSDTLTILGIANAKYNYYEITYELNGGQNPENAISRFTPAEDEILPVPTKESYDFGGWFTNIDLTGERIVSTSQLNDNVTLYAKWVTESGHTITFVTDIGTIAANQVTTYYTGEIVNLLNPTNSDSDFRFKGWYTNQDFSGNAITEVSSSSVINYGSDITLYAKWIRYSYRHNGDYVFDGTNYIDTGVMLFSQETWDKNFEVRFTIKEKENNQTYQSVVFGDLNESGEPYPGILVRCEDPILGYIANITRRNGTTNLNYSEGMTIVIKRLGDIVYYSTDGGNTFTESLDYSSFNRFFDVTATFGAGLDKNLEPFRYFKGTLSNMSVVLSDVEYYTIKYNNNGGTGTMDDQTVGDYKNTTLRHNTFTKANHMFDHWNTKADGTGTSYDDEEIVNAIANPNETITLYAIWKDPINYNIIYYANNETQTQTTQQCKYGEQVQLANNTFTKTGYVFAKWNTEPDGTGKSYLAGQEVENLTKNEGENINLYAIWAKEAYSYANAYVFDGEDYIDTNICLYSSENLSRDFEISFEITDFNPQIKQATIMNSLDEDQNHGWPGLLFRRRGTEASKVEVDISSTSRFNKVYNLDEARKVVIKRTNGMIYISVNDGNFQQTKDHSELEAFDVPVTFGAGIDVNNAPFRFFKGTLSNMSVIVY